MSEKREHLRHEVEWEVEVSTETWDDVLVLTAVSVSQGGLFIRASRPAVTGSCVQVAVRLPDGNVLQLTGEVVRTVEPAVSPRSAPQGREDREPAVSPRSAPQGREDRDPEQSERPGFALRFDSSRSTDLLLLESMAGAFASPGGGGSPNAITAAVTTREVRTEQSTIELEAREPARPPPADESPRRESAPSLSGIPAVEYVEGDRPSAFESQPTRQRSSVAKPAQVRDDEDAGESPRSTGEVGEVEEVPISVEEKPGVFNDEPTRDASAPPPIPQTMGPAASSRSAPQGREDRDPDERSGTYNVGEQIQAGLGADVVEVLVSPESAVPRRDASWPDGPAGSSTPPDDEVGRRPTAESKAADLDRPNLEGQEEVAVMRWRRPSRHSLPALEQRRGTEEALAFGIDFGTTFTSIGLFHDDAVVVLEDDEGHSLVPSAVSYPEQGPALVGWAAREQMILQPATTFVSPKRLIGRNHDDPGLEPILASSPVRYEEGPGGQVVADVHDHPVTMIQVVAEIFRRMAQVGEARSGRPVRKVALAAPVAFDEPQRSAITRAARMGGLEVVAIIDEPVAAAIAFGVSGDEEQLIAVYDFGGGTFDFTLLRAGGGAFDVLGEAGDAWLGGDDLDQALANHVADQFWKQKKIDLRNRQVEWQRLLFLCERAKRQLSRQEETVVEAHGMALSLQGSVDLKVGLNRGLFADLCRVLVERSIETVETCFILTGHDPKDVTDVVLTGGVSRIPMVHQRVEAFFERKIPLVVNPESAIVIGASRFARQAAGVFREEP